MGARRFIGFSFGRLGATAICYAYAHALYQKTARQGFGLRTSLPWGLGVWALLLRAHIKLLCKAYKFKWGSL
ncbi:MAG: hypothetical protein EAY75_08900 [Bacteroidetes bacterium]|nr:MAG: hypothetical protein EAY75_08900 [Bacteroidota bacterium]